MSLSSVFAFICHPRLRSGIQRLYPFLLFVQTTLDPRFRKDDRKGGNSKSRGGSPRSREGARLPRASASLRSPHEGGIPPSKPPFESHPLLQPLHEAAAPFSIFLLLTVWRRGWDSNPRCRCQHTCSPGTPIRPLSHLSALQGLRLKFVILARVLWSNKATRLPHRISRRLTGRDGTGAVPYSFCDSPSRGE